MTLSNCADAKRFKPDCNAIHIRDLNFVLRSKIFVHFDGQLQASHLILSCTVAYTNFQDPRQALTVGSPLLSYLDVRLHNFLPPGLTVSEARRLGPRQVKAGSLFPVRDGLADTIFYGRAEHILIEEPHEEAQVADQVKVKSVSSSEETDTEDPEDEMVVQQTMTVDRFFPSGWPPM